MEVFFSLLSPPPSQLFLNPLRGAVAGAKGCSGGKPDSLDEGILMIFVFQMVICLCSRGGPLNFSSRPDGDQKRRGEGEGSREPCAAP